jgi:hypothetical protein
MVISVFDRDARGTYNERAMLIPRRPGSFRAQAALT